jgi:hypothetical protein
MVWRFLPKGRVRIDNRMFFLGAAFMLLETKPVVQLALLFGRTWLVNMMVFFTMLVLILLANLYVLWFRPVRLVWYYTGVLGFLAAGVLVPLDVFLGGGPPWHYVAPCFLALGPMLFAGVIFARSFQDARDPDRAFGSNIAGSVLGGLSEPFSILLGFRHLLLLAMLFYILSMWSPRGRLWPPRRGDGRNESLAPHLGPGRPGARGPSSVGHLAWTWRDRALGRPETQLFGRHKPPISG